MEDENLWGGDNFGGGDENIEICLLAPAHGIWKSMYGEKVELW